MPATLAAKYRNRVLLVAALVILIVLAWSNALRAPFELDDDSSIRENPTIRHLASLQWLAPPAAHGETVGGRPLVNLSLAVDYAIGGLDVRVYHATNLLIHALAAVALFAVVRRTVVRSAHKWPAWMDGSHFAFVVAALWALHPLQTQSVTYVVQRAQALAGLFCLLTLYGLVRALEARSSDADGRVTSTTSPPKSAYRRWLGFSVAACAFGMAAKEDMVVVPVIVLLFDRLVFARSFGEALRCRRSYYGALAATWIILAVLVAMNPSRGGSAGLHSTIGPFVYLLTQAKAWCHYLRLAVWPTGLVFDYGTPTVASMASVLPQLAFWVVAIAAIIWALKKNHPAGFLGACFCLALAPSSSVVPVATQTVAEHRMYLALAPLSVAVAFALSLVRMRTLGTVLTIALVTALCLLTFGRNRTYASALDLWRDTVAKAPENARAHNNLGLAWRDAGDLNAAADEYHRAIALQPNHAFARNNLGALLLIQGHSAEAAEQFAAAVAADSHFADARVNWGVALTHLGRRDEAIRQFELALQDEPEAADAKANLAALLLDQGNALRAEQLLREAIERSPDLAEAHLQYGRVLESRSSTAAESEYRTAIQLKPRLADAHLALGNLLASRGDNAAAMAAYDEAIRLDPNSASARFALGDAFAHQRQFEPALAQYNEALRLDPNHLEARGNRANCELVIGRLHEAITDYEYVLRARPNDSRVQQNLAIARQLLAERSP